MMYARINNTNAPRGDFGRLLAVSAALTVLGAFAAIPATAQTVIQVDMLDTSLTPASVESGWTTWDLAASGQISDNTDPNDNTASDTAPTKTFAADFGNFGCSNQIQVTAFHRSDRSLFKGWTAGTSNDTGLDGVELEDMRRDIWAGSNNRGALLEIDGLTTGTYEFRLYNNNRNSAPTGRSISTV